jgi:hypothetical protein
MVARPFKNKKTKTKFGGKFTLNAQEYEYTIYLTPLPKKFLKKEHDEIVKYFGTRRFKEDLCLTLNEDSFKRYLKNDDISAFLIVNPAGVDNYASATLQNYDWCNNTNTDMVWINDVCRVSSTGLSGSVGEPLKGLMFLAEQLVVQNLGLDVLKLYIENDPVTMPILKNIYERLGFNYNSIDDNTICPGFLGGDEIVMEKRSLVPLTDIINFSSLLGLVQNNNVNALASGIKNLKTNGGYRRTKKSYKNRSKCTKRRKTSRR